MSTFWDAITSGEFGAENSSLDRHLGKVGNSSVRTLTDAIRAVEALPLPVMAGTRVAFKSNLGSVVAYVNPPEDGAQGTVVMVRSAMGDITSHNGMVFVKWDTGDFFQTDPEHLKVASGVKQASGVSMRVSSLGDISDFMTVNSGTDLVHKATKDLWAVRKDGEAYVIERLFNEDGNPIKI